MIDTKYCCCFFIIKKNTSDHLLNLLLQVDTKFPEVGRYLLGTKFSTLLLNLVRPCSDVYTAIHRSRPAADDIRSSADVTAPSPRGTFGASQTPAAADGPRHLAARTRCFGDAMPKIHILCLFARRASMHLNFEPAVSGVCNDDNYRPN
eukprot:SAG31_NODE_90_length_26410_cov_175.663981_21_plen_149_part_00